LVVVDDREKRIEMMPSEYVPVLKRTKFTEARAKAAATTRFGAVKFVLVVGMGALYGLVSSIWRGQSRGAMFDNGLAFIVVIVIVWLVWLFFVRMKRQQCLTRVVEVGRGFGRCPACTYVLRECAVAADGCTVCPECGGAWRIDKSSGT